MLIDKMPFHTFLLAFFLLFGIYVVAIQPIYELRQAQWWMLALGGIGWVGLFLGRRFTRSYEAERHLCRWTVPVIYTLIVAAYGLTFAVACSEVGVVRGAIPFAIVVAGIGLGGWALTLRPNWERGVKTMIAGSMGAAGLLAQAGGGESLVALVCSPLLAAACGLLAAIAWRDGAI